MHHLFCVIAVQLAILKSINKQIKNASERFDNWRAADNGKLVADDPEFINERKIMTFTLHDFSNLFDGAHICVMLLLKKKNLPFFS